MSENARKLVTTRNILFQHSDVFLSVMCKCSRYNGRSRREWPYVRFPVSPYEYVITFGLEYRINDDKGIPSNIAFRHRAGSGSK